MSGLNDCNIILVENIPYDTSETKLKEIFQQVGPIVSFRLVFDKENKRSTGYCYCEYHDPATSASAIRNLNNVEMEGQKLKVGYADNKSSTITNEVYRLNPSFKSSAQQLSQQQQKLLQQSSNSDSDKSECSSSSSRSSGMNEEQLLDVLLTLQLYSQSTNENQAGELLLQNPLLAYDLFRILFQLDLVDENILKKIVSEKQPERTSNTTTVPINMNCQDLTPEIYKQHQIQQYQLSQQQQQILQQQYQQFSQQSQQYQQQVQLQHQNMFTPSPNVIAQPIQQPIQPIQPLPVGTNLNNPFVGELQIQEQNAALILQLLNLTPQQIDMFPPDQRNRILTLQQQIFLHARRI
ncbi:hypothetical protein RhiirA5_503750 [Rhizophagus irregularis]|uniref:RRM domain-containing protein n=3 Tax=Rhizophagus irregularis TaxID=588596 RepID=A0A2I1F3I3_9GLOM|nr:hypothetical protein RhiirA5_503750 [Rhizophagus irregularis]GBC37924.2 cleavage stimulation factor subunit 2-like [Rhizophagus irregularis DAOM 181602=DAOM 197198]PKC59166.1 hypothetical protein RhiirA1_540648 [Rhizophagus irregularis]PKY28928.1 hypothetical protein RhiirB3_530167 [Rhizophagus irregularis]UZO14029.1 hypothetical protein OCT59_005500 [Rhizophagus irregularis]